MSPAEVQYIHEQASKHQRIVKILNKMELKWSAEQKALHKLKIMEKLDKAKNHAQYTQKLLQLCETWNHSHKKKDGLEVNNSYIAYCSILFITILIRTRLPTLHRIPR